MENTKFESGMPVWLKTYDGPKMIIDELYPVTKNCKCTWFDKDKKYQSQNFAFIILTNIPPPSTTSFGGSPKNKNSY